MENTKSQDKMQQELTLTNEDRIKIIDDVLKQVNIYKNNNMPLEVSLNAGPMKNNQKSVIQDTYLQYFIPGSRIRYKSRLSNLLEKLDDMYKYGDKKQREEMERQKLKEKREGGQSPESASEEQILANLKSEDNFRYYKDNILCFKCGKSGHYKSVCPNPTTCLYCFSEEHESESCPQKKVCFRCYGFGHVIAQCSSKQAVARCQLCEKYHGQGCNFLINRNRDVNKKRQFYDNIYNDKDVRCAKCFNFGHIDCSHQF